MQSAKSTEGGGIHHQPASNERTVAAAATGIICNNFMGINTYKRGDWEWSTSHAAAVAGWTCRMRINERTNGHGQEAVRGGSGGCFCSSWDFVRIWERALSTEYSCEIFMSLSSAGCIRLSLAGRWSWTNRQTESEPQFPHFISS